MKKIITLVSFVVLLFSYNTSNSLTPGWKYHTRLPEGLYGHRAFLLPDGNIMVTGGIKSDGSASSDIYIYNYQNASMISVGSLTSPRAFHSVVVLPLDKSRANIFLIGGYSGQGGNYRTLNSIEFLEYGGLQQNMVWREIGQMKDSRADCKAIWDLGSHIIISGGINQNTGGLRNGQKLKTSEMININSFAITPFKDMAKPRAGHFSGTIWGPLNRYQVMAAGGEEGSVSSTELIENNDWSAYAFAPKDYRIYGIGISDLSFTGRVFGGYNSAGKALNTCEWYDVKAGWKFAPPMLRARADGGYTLVAGLQDTVPSYLLAGGIGTSGAINDAEYFTLPTSASPTGLWTQFSSLNEAGSFRENSISGTNLPLIIGGRNSAGQAINGTEIFQPLSAQDVVFGAEEIGRISDSIPLIIENRWLLPVTATDFRIDKSSEFFFTGDTANFKLGFGSRRQIFVRFRPNGPGLRAGRLLLNIGGMVDTVNLEGTGITSSIAVVTSGTDYGEVFIGIDSVQCFPAIKNNGTDTTYIDSITVTPSTGYRLVSPQGRAKIAPGEVLQVCIAFTPNRRNDIFGSAIINIAARSYSCALSGKGVAKYITGFSNNDCDTVNLVPGKKYQSIVTLTNPGDRPVNVTGYKLIGGQSSYFEILQTFPIIMNPGGRTEISIGFLPPIEGTFRINIEFENDGVKDSLPPLPVCFVVRSKDLTLSEQSIEYGPVCSGDSIFKTLWIENPGAFENITLNSISLQISDTNLSLPAINPTVLGPRERTSVPVSYRAGAPGNYSNTILVNGTFGTISIPVTSKVLPVISISSVNQYSERPGSRVVIPFRVSGDLGALSLTTARLHFVYNSSVLYPSRLLSGFIDLDFDKSKIYNIRTGSFDVDITLKNPLTQPEVMFSIEFEVLLGNSFQTSLEITNLNKDDICLKNSVSEFVLEGVCGGKSGLIKLSGGTLLNIAPNPVSDKINLTFVDGREFNLTCQIVNSLGQIISRQNFGYSRGTGHYEIDASELPSGIYQLRMLNGDEYIISGMIFIIH